MKTIKLKLTEHLLDETLAKINAPESELEIREAFRRKVRQVLGSSGSSKHFGWLNLRMIDASANGDLTRVLWLLNAGACARAYGDRALEGAASGGYVDVIKCLVEHGAHVRSYGARAVSAAAGAGHVGAVKALLAAGANVHAGFEGALTAACHYGHEHVVKVLLAAGADVDDAPFALPVAAGFGHSKVVALLLSIATPKPSIRDDAIGRARRAGYADILRLLGGDAKGSIASPSAERAARSGRN